MLCSKNQAPNPKKKTAKPWIKYLVFLITLFPGPVIAKPRIKLKKTRHIIELGKPKTLLCQELRTVEQLKALFKLQDKAIWLFFNSSW
jgi:hypothetical protein